MINPLRSNRPVPLFLNSNNEIIYYPHSSTVNSSNYIHICCPGNQILYQGQHIPDTNKCITARCLSDTKFEVLDESRDYHDFKCRDIPQNIIRYTGKSCYPNGEEIEIGYDIDNVIIRQITVCFDSVRLSPYYSYYRITRNIQHRDSAVPRKFFDNDGFYPIYPSVDSLYQINNEKRTINSQLDLPPDSNKYIDKYNNDLFINRGHLAAKGDFVYAFEQLATFHYVNSAPQWACFNGGNWNELEISTRLYAENRQKGLDIYTGVYGITTLPNERTHYKVPLYLYNDDRKALLPVPQFFWKIIIDFENHRGIVVIGVNNPYEENIRDNIICNDVSERVTWFNSQLQYQRQNVHMGYIYACSIADSKRVISTIPNEIPNYDLLL